MSFHLRHCTSQKAASARLGDLHELAFPPQFSLPLLMMLPMK